MRPTIFRVCILRVAQGKVRRMRPSPFSKASGQAKAAVGPPAKSRMAPLEDSSGDEGEVPLPGPSLAA